MSSMFAPVRIPKPEPLPESPIQSELRATERERAAAAAVAEGKAGGREGDIHAGRAIAMDKQMARAKKRQSAAEELL